MAPPLILCVDAPPFSFPAGYIRLVPYQSNVPQRQRHPLSSALSKSSKEKIMKYRPGYTYLFPAKEPIKVDGKTILGVCVDIVYETILLSGKEVLYDLSEEQALFSQSDSELLPEPKGTAAEIPL